MEKAEKNIQYMTLSCWNAFAYVSSENSTKNVH